MAVQIKLDQTGKGAGVAGQAREDLDVGTLVTAQAVGGPFSAYQWSFLYKAIDPDVSVEATSAFTSPTSATTDIDPVDQPGTYLVRVTVDSGSGLGASADDVAEITFYAGVAADPLEGEPSADPGELPRRPMAFREQAQHNVPDAIDSGGNRQGWAREWLRWWAVLRRLYLGKDWASAFVVGATPATVRKFNCTVARTSTGFFDVTFDRALPDANYVVNGWVTDGSGFAFSLVSTQTTAGFTMTVLNAAGSPSNEKFGFCVKLGVGE